MKSRFGTLSGLLALAAIVVGLLPGLTLAQPEPDAQKMPASPPPNVAAPAPGAAPSLEPPPPAQGPQDAIQRLAQDTGDTARVTLSRATGVAKFIRLQAGSLPYRLKTPGPQAAVEQGQAFLAAYGAAFGIADPGRELELVSTQTDQVGGLHVLYRQVYRGVPVFAGLLKIHFDAGGALVAANGTFIPNLKLNPTPLLNAEQVTETALRRVIRQQTDENEFAPFGLAAKHAALLIFRANLARGIPGQNHLAFEVEVTNGATVREFVYVDAHSGQIIDQISGIHQIEREISEATLSNVVWDEGNGDPDPIPGGWAGGTAQQVTDWQNELDGALETYNLFASMSGGNYLSYDSNDAIMRTVNNDPGISCPNANWNGVSTNYCSNVTGDDTVAHEWGHAYTEYTSNLIYQWQSGALNESYSDMWGEVVDLLNGRGADAPGGLRTDGGCSTLGIGAPSVDNTYRWLSGEDDPAFGGAIRDMWNPPCYGDPGHVLDSTNYWCAAGDGGGVHTNSGVPNHAFALLVDGGTYTNSTTTITVTAIGITKTAHIHWLAQQMLTPASDFTDHTDALEAACTALTGQPLFELSTAATGAGASPAVISAADCAQVANAIAAVELRAEPTQCGFAPILDPDAPPFCPAGRSQMDISTVDWEAGLQGWSAGRRDVADPATFDTPDWTVVSSLPDGRAGSGLFVEDNPAYGDCAADTEAGVLYIESPLLTIPAGAAAPMLAFDHWVATELGWDGGNVKLSVNGGAWTLLPPAAFQFNSYPTFLNSSGLGNDNPLAGEPAFTGTDGGSFTGSWGRSQLSLSGYAAPGDTVRLRFEMGLDGCNGVVGWYVDQVDLYYCQIDNPTTIRGAVSDAVTGWPLYSRVNVTPFGGATEAHFADPVTGQYSVTVAANVTHTLLISSVIGGYNTASRSVVPPPISSTQNFTLTANSTLCVAPGYNPAGTTALYAEDFEADDGGYIADPVGEWEWGAPGYTGVITTAHSGSNVWGTDLNADATDAIGNHTLTATLSIPAAGASLKWWDWFGDEAADERQLFVNGVEVYNDNGGTDQRVWTEHTVDVSTWAGQTVDVVFNLSVCCGEPGPDGWYIDDVSLEVTTCTPQPGGLLAGNVYDQNTGQALNGVAVKTQDAYTATTAATSFDPAVDDGFYYLFSPAGTKTVTATLQRYGPAVDSVTVALSDTVRHNFNLLAGTVLAAPRALSVTLSPGMSATLPLSLTNGGGYPARFDLFEEDSGFTPLKTQNRVAAGQRVLFDATHGGNAATYDELMADLTAAGFAIDIAATGPISAAGLAAHDIYWIPDSTTIAWSAAELSAVQNWVGGGGSVFINYDCCDDTTAPVVAALFDITFTGSGGSGGVTTDIAPHPTTQGVSAVNLPSPFQSLAVGGSAVGLVNDVGGDLQAAANRAGGGKAVVVADDAFNDNGNYASSDNTLFAANIFNWLAIPSNVPWLFQDPISATLAPAASGQFSITFDAGVPEATQPGDYAATLIVQNDTPYGEAQIPVTMTVTPPGAWGKLAGTVTGLGYCDANPAPLDAAIFIQGSTGATWTLTAGTDGAYLLWLPEANRPLTATVAYSGYLTQTVAGIQITGAQTTTLDVDLRLNAPCAGAAPADFAASQRAGVVSTQTLLISNTGAASLSWQLTEAPAPKAVSIGPALPPAPAKNRGNVERRSAPPRKQNAGVPGAPPAAGLNPVVDGGFEAGPNGGTWNEFSTNFGTPICDVFTCGFGNGTGPRSGLYWAWFGGFGGGLEDGSVDQDITIPRGSGTLTFWLEIPIFQTGSGDYFEVLLDNSQIYSVTETGVPTFSTYTQVSLDISPYADGATHNLKFHALQSAAGTSNFFLDDVAMDITTGCTGDIPWASGSPVSGTVPSGGATPVVVTVDSTGLTAGQTVSGTLCIESNDTNNSPLEVPVRLNVLFDTPVISLQKTVGAQAGVCAATDTLIAAAGSSVTYCYRVENRGPFPLNRHTLVDDRLGTLLASEPYILAPGAVYNYTATISATQSVTNTAVWTAVTLGTFSLPTVATATARLTVVNPAIVLTKTVGAARDVCAATDSIAVGEGTQVTYCYAIKNTGDITLSLHTLSDSAFGVLLNGFSRDVGPGQRYTFLYNTTPTQTVVNTATWTASGDTFGAAATNAATVTVLSLAPSISLQKTVGAQDGVCANGSNISLVEGSRAVYCYRVTNTSVVTLSLHTLSDNRLGTLLSGAFFELGPGQSYAFITATTILTDTVNTATWTANNADGTLSLPPVATDAATVTVLASSRFKTYLPLVIKP